MEYVQLAIIIIIPAANANSHQSELDNVELWSRANNLKVNPAFYNASFTTGVEA